MSIAQQTRSVRMTSVGWMIQRLSRRLDDEMSRRLSAHGLTLQHFAVMMTVLEEGGLTQSGIGERFAMPAYAISRALDHLEAKGFVERRAHPTSRRAFVIYATQAGLDLSEALHAIVRETNETLLSALDEQERESFRASLAKLL